MGMVVLGVSEVRITTEHRWLPRVERGERFEVQVDGRAVGAHRGETIATVLLAAGYRSFGHADNGAPRGLYCGMGVCFNCLVTVDGVAGVRACITPAQPGMRIETGSAGVAPDA